MKPNILEIEAQIQIQKPVHTVFEAITDPAKMSNYFISYGSGYMEEDKHLIWRFPEFDEDVPIHTGKIEKDQYISFHWIVEDKDMLVEITLSSSGNDSTIVHIAEKSMENNEAGIQWLKGNTEGWANFLACLKAYLEYGINLRKGAFDFMRDNE